MHAVCDGPLLMAEKMLCTWLVTSINFAVLGGHPLAQSFVPSSRSTTAPPNALARRHVGPNGKPCLALQSYTKPELINKHIFEHWIKATNSCGQHIALQVCYHQSADCIVMNVPPWDSKSSVLGIYPMKDFQYDTKEKF
jgi:hypothetical protein